MGRGTPIIRLCPVLVFVLLSACHPRGNTQDAGAELDAGSITADGGPPDGGFEADAGLPANIEAALNCGTPLTQGAALKPGQMQRHDIDRTRFPLALCNDGTAAVLYFRPYVGAANRDRWVISLRGGGGCQTADACAARWCSCNSTTRCPYAAETTNFNLNNMSGGGPGSLEGGGVLSRQPPLPSPFRDYNQVQFIYCSSDGWRGNAAGVTYTTRHPRTGAEATYTLHFLGARILDADVRTLQQDGVPPLTYTLGGAPVSLPDLDEAQEVVLVGDSAGGAGIINNLDRLAQQLRSSNTACDGGQTCPPRVRGIIDAAVGPDSARLDWSHAPAADAGYDTWDKRMAAIATLPAERDSRPDESCVAWHDAHVPGTSARCLDTQHVVRHHVTTPFFVRMALLDALFVKNAGESMAEDPILGPLTAQVFAKVLQRELSAFNTLPQTAEEGTAMARAPGVFAPACTNHDTIHEDSEVYGVTLSPGGQGPYRFFDVFNAWETGGSPQLVLTQDPMRSDTHCPP